VTAEVAVMNKMAVALAADSAITFDTEGAAKIYNSGTKLFSLSKRFPVGVMIYGNAEFMGIPWETAVKYYRSKLADRSFDTLAEYADHFISYLETDDAVLCPREVQDAFARQAIRSCLQDIVRDMNRQVAELFEAAGKVSPEDVAQAASTAIHSHHETWAKCDLLPGRDADCISEMIRSYKTAIADEVANVFQEVPLSPDHKQLLREISAGPFCKDRFPASASGVVIAGFGERELFPSLVGYVFEGVMGSKLKHRQQDPVRIDLNNTSAIVPFAQREMVSTFVEGIDPEYKQTLEAYVRGLASGYPEVILDSVPELPPAAKTDLLAALEPSVQEVIDAFQEWLTGYMTELHIAPILDAVSLLPMDELATMAESLVSLTSFKRRVTLQQETVGGPIDVAVISKGDGFVWIKRKQYFDPDINRAFFARYFGT
jgi:hypothetical protein